MFHPLDSHLLIGIVCWGCVGGVLGGKLVKRIAAHRCDFWRRRRRRRTPSGAPTHRCSSLPHRCDFWRVGKRHWGLFCKNFVKSSQKRFYESFAKLFKTISGAGKSHHIPHHAVQGKRPQTPGACRRGWDPRLQAPGVWGLFPCTAWCGM